MVIGVPARSVFPFVLNERCVDLPEVSFCLRVSEAWRVQAQWPRNGHMYQCVDCRRLSGLQLMACDTGILKKHFHLGIAAYLYVPSLCTTKKDRGRKE